jgi:hypothetical protein
MKLLYLVLLSLITSGCALTTIDTELENASIATKDTIFIYGDLLWDYSKNQNRENESTEYIRLEISSKKELYQYFVKDGDRILQARCKISCEECKTSSDLATFGPYYDNRDISRLRNSGSHIKKNEDGLYHYSIYTYRNLKSNEHYTHGQKIPEISQGNFDTLSCYLIGITKAPVIFPRSNSFSITGKEFDKIYLKFKSEHKE